MRLLTITSREELSLKTFLELFFVRRSCMCDIRVESLFVLRVRFVSTRLMCASALCMSVALLQLEEDSFLAVRSCSKTEGIRTSVNVVSCWSAKLGREECVVRSVKCVSMITSVRVVHPHHELFVSSTKRYIMEVG